MPSEPQKTVMTFTGHMRRDGKFPVTFFYPGEPNAFGGYYPSKTRKRLLNEAKARDLAETYNRVGVVKNSPFTKGNTQ